MARPQYINLQFQPGLFKNGTVYQAQGRWYDADLMRWSNGAIGPIGGWRAWGASTTAVTGVPRTSVTWMDNRNKRWIGVGSASKLYVYDSSASIYDITPAGFTAGNTDADPNTGYGDWLYGKSSYGTPRPDLGIPVPATIWSLAMWGEDLTGCTPDDGDLYLWDTSVGTGTIAARVANSPQFITATIVTPQRSQMCFGGVASGGLLVNAVVVANNTAYWMGRNANGFFMYDGYTRNIPCDVEEFVTTNMNEAQSSKTVGWHNSLYSEIVWFYPGSGTEVDAYVSYNYLENHWSVGTLARTSTTSRGIFAFPILFDSSGNPYEHEIGGTYTDLDDTTYTPYVESGPIQLGMGNEVLSATSLIPDVTALGDITTTFYTRFYPTDSDTTHGPYTMAAPTSVRFTGRSVRMRCTSNSANPWNVGIPRLELQPNGRR